MTMGSITLSSLTQHCLCQCHLLIAYHLTYNSPSISIWLAVFSPPASGRCNGGIFSQSGRTHNFHHICCLAAWTALKPGLIIIIMTLSPPQPVRTSPGPPVSISKHCYFWSNWSSCLLVVSNTCNVDPTTYVRLTAKMQNTTQCNAISVYMEITDKSIFHILLRMW